MTDADSSDKLIGASVTITSNLTSGDTLNFTGQNGITGVYSNGVLTLTGSATVEQYQAALNFGHLQLLAGQWRSDPQRGRYHTDHQLDRQ